MNILSFEERVIGNCKIITITGKSVQKIITIDIDTGSTSTKHFHHFTLQVTFMSTVRKSYKKKNESLFAGQNMEQCQVTHDHSQQNILSSKKHIQKHHSFQIIISIILWSSTVSSKFFMYVGIYPFLVLIQSVQYLWVGRGFTLSYLPSIHISLQSNGLTKIISGVGLCCHFKEVTVLHYALLKKCI